MVLEIASGVCVHRYEKGRHVGAEGAFSVRTVYPWLSREQPPSTVNLNRCASATGCSSGISCSLWWNGSVTNWWSGVPNGALRRGEQVYLGIAQNTVCC